MPQRLQSLLLAMGASICLLAVVSCSGSGAPQTAPPLPADTPAQSDAPHMNAPTEALHDASSVQDVLRDQQVAWLRDVLEGSTPWQPISDIDPDPPVDDPPVDDPPVDDPVIDDPPADDPPQLPPPGPEGEISGALRPHPDGPEVLAGNGERRLFFQPQALAFENEAGEIIERRQAQLVNPQEIDGRQVLVGLFGEGFDLLLHEEDEGLRSNLRIDSAARLPEGATQVVLEELLRYDPAWTLRVDEFALEVGDEANTPGAFELRGAGNALLFVAPTPVSQDAAGEVAPWMHRNISVELEGRARVRTSLGSAWLREADRAWPVLLDPSFLPERRDPVFASVNAAPLSPGDTAISLAVSVTNFRGERLAMLVDWGDRSEREVVSRATAHLTHRYRYAGVYRVAVQLCDLDEDAPRCTRRSALLPVGGEGCGALDDDCVNASVDSRTGTCKLDRTGAASCERRCDWAGGATRCENSVATSAPVDRAAGCSGSRFVGVRSGSSCPEPQRPSPFGRWVTRELLAGDELTGVTGALRSFCVYDWQPRDGDVFGPDRRALPDDEDDEGRKIPAHRWMSPDCHVVSAQGPVTEALWTGLREPFYQQAGHLNPMPPIGNSVETRVAVVDSSPDNGTGGRAGFGQFDHGFAVGRTIRGLACPNGGAGPNPCAAAIHNTLALPRETLTRVNPDEGGFFGTQSELARAIVVAVERWREFLANNPGAGPVGLVINLSVAWDGAYGGPFEGSDPSVLDNGVESVYRAIEYATCRGALVIAAAGNDIGGPEPSVGPMYPAGWEVKRRPPACDPGSDSDYRPLIYAVSGVDGRDVPLHNSRRQGTPRLVAPGRLGVSSREDGGVGTPTQVLTGSSVAAAVVSAIAASVWSYRPNLTAYEVADIVYDSGANLDLVSGSSIGRSADYCLEGFTCSDLEQRRANLCEALTLACTSAGSACAPPACVNSGAYRDLRPVPSAGDIVALDNIINLAIARGVGISESGAGINDVKVTPPACGSDTIIGAVGQRPRFPCPGRQFYRRVLRPATGPQPPSVPCDVCVAVGPPASMDLSVTVDTVFSGVAYSPTLSVIYLDGTKKNFSLESEIISMKAGDMAKLLGVDVSCPACVDGTIKYMNIEWVVDMGSELSSVVDAVYYEP